MYIPFFLIRHAMCLPQVIFCNSLLFLLNNDLGIIYVVHVRQYVWPMIRCWMLIRYRCQRCVSCHLPFVTPGRNAVRLCSASQIIEATPGTNGHALFMVNLVDLRPRFVGSLKRVGARPCLHLRISPFIIAFPLPFIGALSMP